MPAPYTNPSGSQLQQKRKIFLGADKFASSGGGTLTRFGKGNWYWALAAATSPFLMNTLDLAITDFTSANIDYKQNGAANGDLSFNSISAFYVVAGANLAVLTVGVTESSFGAASVPTVTDLIAPTALPGIITTNIQQAIATPQDNSRLILAPPAQIITELAFVIPAGGLVHFYGAMLDVMYSR